MAAPTKPPKIYKITPVPAPRMTRRDKWLKPARPEVARYRAFSEECFLRGVKLKASGCHVIFVLPMPDGWSKKKKLEMDGEPHQQVPDSDNLLKALQDAIFKTDSHIWDIRITKLWGIEGSIIIHG